MSYELIATLVILFIMIAMFVSNKFSFGGVAIVTICLLELSGVLTPKEAWDGLLNSSIPLMVSMFMLGAGLAKTSILGKITGTLVKPGANNRQIMFGIAVLCVFFGLFVNATASITLVTPIIYQICRDTGKKPVELFPAAGAICMIFNGVIPLGGNAGSFNVNNAYIDKMGGVGTQGYFTHMLTSLPSALIVTAFIIFTWHLWAPKPDRGAEVDTNVEVKEIKSSLTPGKEKLMYAIFAVSLALMLYGTLSGKYSMYIPTCLGAFIMVASGICTVKEAHSSAQLGIVFISIGSLAIATALGKTGGTELIGGWIQKLLAGTESPIVVFAVFVLVCAVITQFMNNQAVSSVFKPIVVSTAISMGFNATGFLLAINASSRAAMATPMSAPSQAIAMGAGGVNMKDYFKANIIPLIVWIVAYLITAPLMLPLTY